MFHNHLLTQTQMVLTIQPTMNQHQLEMDLRLSFHNQNLPHQVQRQSLTPLTEVDQLNNLLMLPAMEEHLEETLLLIMKQLITVTRLQDQLLKPLPTQEDKLSPMIT